MTENVPFVRSERRRRQPTTGAFPESLRTRHLGPHGGTTRRPRRTTSARPMRDMHRRTLLFLIENPGADKFKIARGLETETPTAEHVLTELERMQLAVRVHGYPETWRPA